MSQRRVPIFVVDAFTERLFCGNPAAVCLLEKWLPDEVLQSIAAENNLSETSFVIVQSDGLCRIRWFTPSTEVELCGHATLAAAFVVLRFVRPDLHSVRFVSSGGNLGVHSGDADRLYLNFPCLPTELYSAEDLKTALNTSKECSVFKSHYDALVVFEDEDAVADLLPDLEMLKQLDVRGVIVTSEGRDVDFVSRFFAPGVGIDEDPVTGSAHCVLIPYWSMRLKKTKLLAKQLSRRGGTLYCEDLRNGRVEIGGNAVLYSRGEIYLDDDDHSMSE